MRIFIIDQEPASSQLIKAKLESMGHAVTVKADKSDFIKSLAAEDFEIVLINPSPLKNAQSIVLNIRRSIGRYLYMFLMSGAPDRDQALKEGLNDALSLPLDPEELEAKIHNAARMTTLIKRIGDDSYDFPSAGGVIAKSAFNQLFLSAIDRSSRYAERNYTLMISVSNYREILQMDGAYAADYATAKLSQFLVLERRQSDIIAQIEKYEYALLLQRPAYENEPIEAAKRFWEVLLKQKDIVSSGQASVELTISLLEIPTGRRLFEEVINTQPQ